MAAKQTAVLMGRFVEHQDYFNPLPTKDAQWAIQNPKDAAALCVTAIKGRSSGAPKAERTYKVLRPVAPMLVARGLFKADDTFFADKASVKITCCGDNFKAWFAGKIEEDTPEGEPRPFTLTRSAYDREIIADLGGEGAAEVALEEVWRLMERQASGGEGTLLTNEYINIFYIRDINGALRAVLVWDDVGWCVDALALDGRRWYGGHQVFSLNS